MFASCPAVGRRERTRGDMKESRNVMVLGVHPGGVRGGTSAERKLELTDVRLCRCEWLDIIPPPPCAAEEETAGEEQSLSILILITLAGGENGLSICARGVPNAEESGVRNGSRRSSERRHRGCGSCR